MTDLTIPAFLRRSDRLTDEQVRQLTRTHENRVWVMPKYVEKTTIDGDQIMAKAEFLIEDRASPVTVYSHPVEDMAKPFHVFPDAAAFEAWYRPNKTRFCGQNTGKGFTDVLLDLPPGTRPPSAAFPVRRLAPTTGSRRQDVKTKLSAPPVTMTMSDSPSRPGGKATVFVSKGKAVQEGMRYIDSRHVTLMEEAGLVNLGTWPMTFLYKHTTIDFEPPPEGRRWATTWSFKDAAGRGVATLFVALGIKEAKS